MGKKTIFMIIVSVIVALTLTCGNWREWQVENNILKAIVKNPRFETAFGDPKNKISGLAVDLHIQYLGPDDGQVSPDIYLTQGESQEKIYAVAANFGENEKSTYDIFYHLNGTARRIFALKQGEYLTRDPVAVLWNVPQGPAYWLHVANLPPINIF